MSADGEAKISQRVFYKAIHTAQSHVTKSALLGYAQALLTNISLTRKTIPGTNLLTNWESAVGQQKSDKKNEMKQTEPRQGVRYLTGVCRVFNFKLVTYASWQNKCTAWQDEDAFQGQTLYILKISKLGCKKFCNIPPIVRNPQVKYSVCSIKFIQ